MPASTPSFLLEAHDAYQRCREIGDNYFKVKALESTFATLVKYLGTSFAVMALDKVPRVGVKAASRIFSSSSLGGWTRPGGGAVHPEESSPRRAARYR